jgi:hypothetical protein
MYTQATPMPQAPTRARVHDMDKVRIERALRHRIRYRYVQPQIERGETGWVITSPCCSRNIDPTGGVIDIAWVEPVEGAWALYFKEICVDPMRVFWP